MRSSSCPKGGGHLFGGGVNGKCWLFVGLWFVFVCFVDEIFNLVGENGTKNAKFRGKAGNVLYRRNFFQDFEKLACFH